MKNSDLWAEPFRTLAFSLVFLCVMSVSGASAQDCTATTDAQLVTTIYDKVKADRVLGPQISHIIIGSVNRFVKLQGWTDSKSDFERLHDLVSKVPCVIAINVNRFEETPPPADSPLRPQPGGCGPGMKACGDVCIPENDSCSDRTKAGSDD
jgi:hypothetical protein